MNNLDILSTPYRLKNLHLPNRVVMAPMTRGFSPGGVPTADVAAYYRRRAEHGVGLIITEATGVDRPASVNEPDVPLFYGEAALAAWKKVVDEVHSAGGRIMPQLWHVGQKRSNNKPNWQPPAPYESPSGLSVTGNVAGKPMTDGDIADTIDAFARAAAQAERLGFDGVELHGGHGYLINQFFLAELNTRDDAYGGATLIERSRFAVEILKAVRRSVSADFPVIFRFSQWKPQDFEARLAESPEVLGKWLNVLVHAGVDAFDCSQRRYWEPAFPEADETLNFAGWAKKLTGVTSIAVGSVGLGGDVYGSFAGKRFKPAPLKPLLARLERDEFDLVAVGRPLLQDPAWLEKVLAARTDELADFTPEALASLS
ncbi:NADH:flavin oxidoreductase/NADH oxidase [Paraburkholderia atlantica]|uniref:NADH:flavin oxidoreductase/NADH oxidase n=1 Tax=Paraburkholderia atlantica TaxID=2654982 RepID=D5WFF4_PARAM|nr:NADH:flavin oxidoreductase [Paraburkholderia atlantica]ADG19308.1 NADH:flavin oxidoreductase/NADH oxidase [Paraburkholderia atlantica]